MKKSESTLLDLGSLEATETATLELRHPTTGKAIPGATITAYGKDSRKFEVLQNKSLRKRLKKRNSIPDPEDFNRENLEILAELITGWAGIVVDGSEIPYTKDNAIQLFERFKWIKEQVDEFVGDRLNFLPSV